MVPITRNELTLWLNQLAAVHQTPCHKTKRRCTETGVTSGSMKILEVRWVRAVRGVFEVVAVVVMLASGAFAADATSIPTPTLARDVEPIFQQKCQACHRPDSIVPMSLVKYEEARPRARSIRARVVARQR